MMTTWYLLIYLLIFLNHKTVCKVPCPRLQANLPACSPHYSFNFWTSSREAVNTNFLNRFGLIWWKNQSKVYRLEFIKF